MKVWFVLQILIQVVSDFVTTPQGVHFSEEK
jgi:hypothetical protein